MCKKKKVEQHDLFFFARGKVVNLSADIFVEGAICSVSLNAFRVFTI